MKTEGLIQGGRRQTGDQQKEWPEATEEGGGITPNKRKGFGETRYEVVGMKWRWRERGLRQSVLGTGKSGARSVTTKEAAKVGKKISERVM